MASKENFLNSLTSGKISKPITWCTDFDGTFSEYVFYQDEAVPVPGAVDALLALKKTGLDVVIVSGRPVSYLRNQLGDEFPLYGSYGTESFVDGVYALTEIGQKWQPKVERFSEQVLALLDELGAPYEFSARTAHSTLSFFVEEKPISFSLNTQPGDHQRKLRKYVDELYSALDASSLGLSMEDYGTQILVHPADFSRFMNKSTVIELLSAKSHVVFCGDDASDIDAASVAKKKGGDVVIVNNQTSPPGLPSPQELLDLADYTVGARGSSSSQQEFIAFVTEVAEALS